MPIKLININNTTYVPIDALEIGVCLYVLNPIDTVTQPVGRVTLEQDPQEGLGLGGEELGHP